MYLKAYKQNFVKNGPVVMRKASFNFHMYRTLGQGQETTLTFKTHIPSLTHLAVCIYQFSGHRLQLFLKNPLFSLFPIEKPILQNLTLPLNRSRSFHSHHLNNYDGQESPMLHTKFRGNRPAGSGEEDL